MNPPSSFFVRSRLKTFVIGGVTYTGDVTPHLRKRGLNNIVESVRKALNIPRSVNKEQAHQIIRTELLK